MKKVMYFVLAAGLAWAGCSSPAGQAAATAPDVYVLGVQSSTNTPGWWKNGVFTAVPLGTGQGSRTAAVLEVVGSDVYIGGQTWATDYSSGPPTLWKNGGPPVYLDSGGLAGSVTGLAVSAGHQVVSGDFYDASQGKHVMKLWTDGTTAAASAWVLQGNGSTEGGFSGALAFRGNDALFAATESQGSTQNAVLWTNGVPAALSTSGKATAYGLVVQGADVYVGGLQSGTVTVWKNGTPLWSSPALSEVTVHAGQVVAAAGTDTWVVGNSEGVATVWKNGVRQALGTVVGQSDATCIAAHGTDVYIGGLGLEGISGYWLNGVFQAVPDCGAVYDIAVL